MLKLIINYQKDSVGIMLLIIYMHLFNELNKNKILYKLKMELGYY